MEGRGSLGRDFAILYRLFHYNLFSVFISDGGGVFSPRPPSAWAGEEMGSTEGGLAAPRDVRFLVPGVGGSV